ncbi:MAG: 4-hydroxy-3-methylbut-2-en-1-yl diphosphate synthase [Candidatus Cloacimonas sp. 4484_209]|nr:MAG: 4-hydroxy-3-methylbut-2-en-1-yl diphosphate synthase [Candidatus Cloacimonas sp. 4484_209]
MIKRRKTKEIKIGNKIIGGEHPILVQSMTNTYTGDLKSTLNQIKKLQDEGCEIIRVAVPDNKSCENVSLLKKQIDIPLVADIHYDYRMAIRSIENGADKIRINPGNIGKKENVKKIVKKAKDRGIPIRIGVNAGSLEKELWEKYGGPLPEALVESTLKNIEMVESFGFNDIVVSIKSSSILDTIEANRMIADKMDYPIHLGITEAGPLMSGTTRSAAGIGILLYMGIGDTIRVSLTDKPEKEIGVAFEILQSLELRHTRPTIISCPTCGRMEIDLIPIVKEVEKRIHNIRQNIKIAIMGCVVNGPGEARVADVGIAGGKGVGVVFRKGKIIKNVKEEQLLDALMEEIERIVEHKK